MKELKKTKIIVAVVACTVMIFMGVWVVMASIWILMNTHEFFPYALAALGGFWMGIFWIYTPTIALIKEVKHARNTTPTDN